MVNKFFLALILAALQLAGISRAAESENYDVLSEQEQQIGRYAEYVIVHIWRVADEPREVNRIRKVVRRLLPATERGKVEYTFHVLDTKEKNALTMSNARIMVTRGLLQMLTNDDELAWVVGHEMGHVNHRDHIRVLEHRDKTLARRILVGGTIGLIPVAGEKLGYALMDQGYEHQQEFEADEAAVRYMVAAGFHPQAALDVIAKFDADPEMRNKRAFFATHPTDRRRAENVQRVIQQLAANGTNVPAGSVTAKSSLEKVP